MENTFVSTSYEKPKKVIKLKKPVAEKPNETKPKVKATKKSKEGAEQCAICMEDYNGNTRKRVECQHCHGPMCRTCFQTYLLDAGMVPLCMMPECKLPWTDEFVETNTLTTWRLKDLKKAREVFLYDQQRSRLPETQAIAEDYVAATNHLKNWDEAVVKPAREHMESFQIHKDLQTTQEAIDAHNELYKQNKLSAHTFYESKQYQEYQEWSIKANALWNHMIDLKRKRDEKPNTKEAAEKKATLTKQWRSVERKRLAVVHTLRRDNPNFDVFQNAEYVKIAADSAKLNTELLEVIRLMNEPSLYKKAIKAYQRAKSGDNDTWRARRCIESYGRTAFVGGTVNKTETEKRAFVRACPAADCRGFLSTAWKCGLCNVWVCPDCHDIKKEQKDDSHKCDPGAIETAKLLAKEAKPCPKCAAQISKIDGCDQMWCTQCHTSFSWRTGQETKDGEWIHNPHYYEWMRRNGKVIPRTPGDPGRAGVDPCGGFIQWHQITPLQAAYKCLIGTSAYPTAIEFARRETTDESKTRVVHTLGWRLLEAIHQNVSDMRWRYQRRPEILTQVDIYQDLRVKFLVGEITEEDVKVGLQRKDKARRKTKADWDIHNMYITACNDIFQLFAGKQITLFDALFSLEDLRHYTNEMLEDNRKRFNNVFHPIKGARDKFYMVEAYEWFGHFYRELKKTPSDDKEAVAKRVLVEAIPPLNDDSHNGLRAALCVRSPTSTSYW